MGFFTGNFETYNPETGAIDYASSLAREDISRYRTLYEPFIRGISDEFDLKGKVESVGQRAERAMDVSAGIETRRREKYGAALDEQELEAIRRRKAFKRALAGAGARNWARESLISMRDRLAAAKTDYGMGLRDLISDVASTQMGAEARRNRVNQQLISARNRREYESRMALQGAIGTFGGGIGAAGWYLTQ